MRTRPILILVAHVLRTGALGVQLPRQSLSNSRRRHSEVVAKTVFSTSRRVLFIAGLEGTGHHELVNIWQRAKEIGKVAVDYPVLLKGWGCDGEWSERYITTNARRLANLSGRVAVIDTKLSYPCGLGSHAERALEKHPHLPYLARAAERGSADLRVVVLLRNAADTLVSTCLHRSFESCSEQAETLALNAQALLAQLLRLDRAFVSCARIESPDGMTASLEAASGEPTDLDIAELVAATYNTTTSNASLPAEVKDHLQLVEDAMLTLESFCAGMPSAESGGHDNATATATGAPSREVSERDDNTTGVDTDTISLEGSDGDDDTTVEEMPTSGPSEAFNRGEWNTTGVDTDTVSLDGSNGDDNTTVEEMPTSGPSEAAEAPGGHDNATAGTVVNRSSRLSASAGARRYESATTAAEGAPNRTRFRAVVLSFDDHHVFAASMIKQYQVLWPDHPFVFHVPFNSLDANLSMFEEFGDRVKLSQTPVSISDTVLALLRGTAPDEMIYFAIDDKYPIALEVDKLSKAVGWMERASVDVAFGGLSFGCMRGLPTSQVAGKQADSVDNVTLLQCRRHCSFFWGHHFTRAWVIQELYEIGARLEGAGKIRRAKDFDRMLDAYLDECGSRVKFWNLPACDVRFGEATHRGRITRNAEALLTKLGVHVPESYYPAVDTIEMQ